MKGDRHCALGIKQAIRLEWMQKAADFLLAGLDKEKIRRELQDFVSETRANGSKGRRSDETRNFAVGNLMKIWVVPEPSLVPFRDASLKYLGERPSASLAIHWGMISAAYPFWFNVARQAGRLLALQDKVTQGQIVKRLKEHYGDRQSVSRFARFVIRSFVAWGILNDSGNKGCYEKSGSMNVSDSELVSLMFESSLHAVPQGKEAVGILLKNPAFFPFRFPAVAGELVARLNDRVEAVRYGLDDELLQLKETVFR